eukprot:TRINITY_DN15719_c1_g1_i1.p1 TRINITY_DN15719_c1_g1~~TRINITY_DN15719_c1_g1_i1.p1  ORF type:complete len:950 (+),score=211.44 TRINITY_DN15719_c1_g1_i1:413-2851(+)
MTPPTSGWQVPYDGPPDPSLFIGQNSRSWEEQPWQQSEQQYQEDGQDSQSLNPQESMHQQRILLDENKKKLEEANKNRMEEQRARMEMMKKQQEELLKKKIEMELDAAKKREEQRAVIQIRRVIQQLRMARPDNFVLIQHELEQMMKKELPNCGEQAERMTLELSQGFEQAKLRMEQLKELDERYKQALEGATKLLEMLSAVIVVAEGAAQKLQTAAEPMTRLTYETTLDELNDLSKIVDEAGSEAKAKGKLCTDFILSKGADMKPTPPPGHPPCEQASQLAELLKRINECTKTAETTLAAFKEKRDRLMRRFDAKRKAKELGALFEKYDKDNDEVLNREEVLHYAREEYDFEIPLESLDQIFAALVLNGATGIKKGDLHSLKLSVGMAREKVKDAQRRTDRIEKERKLAEMKEKLDANVKRVAEQVEEAEALVFKAEQTATESLAQADTTPVADMFSRISEIARMIPDAQEAVKSVREHVGGLGKGVEQELALWISGEVLKLENQMSPYDDRLAKASTVLSKYREATKRRELDSLVSLEKKVMDVVRHQKSVRKISLPELYAAIDVKGDGRVDQEELRAFINSCDPLSKGMHVEASGQAEKSDEGKGQAEDQAATSIEETISEEDISTFFQFLDEDDEGFIGKDRFSNMLRVVMKVCRDSVVTTAANIKEGKTLRRLDVGEFVEILEGPVKDESVDVQRVRARVMRDSLEGWLTFSGNTGATYLEDAKASYKVVKTTILTGSFKVDGLKRGKRQHDVSRRLLSGEIVEPLEWPRMDEESGLHRIRCRVSPSGAIGWATTVGNEGNVLLELV